ncbi:SxtJ family membrane protein [Polyangium mundeleinium]|uniref:SxtJ family membrane protein n=1 Tax=Polyangium mundeleinium TaxID=2995306 RepID=A0ABT5EQ16_9BACT|nr:SxtJ family membrane protein [Polyangium mundeleinium]MDC0743926.1 SxtJ family membrane protein [Polyangium mundeleinium]
MSTRILGLSAFYHDAAAALVIDGEIVAAAQEERFSRLKNDDAFPRKAVSACLAEAGIEIEDLDHVAFYEKPLLKLDRILETHLSCAPFTFPQFRRGLPTWLERKLFLPRELARGLDGRYRRAFVFTDHHEAHAAAAFFPSPFEEAAILTVDGVGEWSTTTLGLGRNNRIELSHELRFPHSLGLLYSAFTQWAGFEVNTGEYMLMGLAPYGEPRYEALIRERMIDLKPDGSFRLEMRFFDWLGGLTMISPAFERLFGAPARAPGAPIEQVHKDVAASIQRVTEDILLRLARTVAEKTGAKQLCLGGGCALNSVAVGRIRREGPFERVWVQPAAGDAGSAAGVALFVWHHLLGKPREARAGDTQRASLLGPAHDAASIGKTLAGSGLRAHELDEEALVTRAAEVLSEGRVLGFFQGRMEFGPRALGSRSILADPRVAGMKDTINRKIKFREGFRPFAPSVLHEDALRFFDIAPGEELPYMTHVVPVRKEAAPALPATTHVDGSARIQTVDEARHGLYARLLQAFRARTGCPVLLNTSFNVRGEPIVCTPEDALRGFARTDLDGLVLERFLLLRDEQPPAALAALAASGAPAKRAASLLDRLLRPEDAHPSRRTLLQFGLLLLALGVVFGGVVWRRSRDPGDLVAGALAGAALLAGTQIPGLGRGMYRAWMALGALLGAVISPLVLGAIYLVIFAPISLARSLLGRDPLGLRFDRNAASYLSDKRTHRDPRRYLRLY